jgi:hypothetical protein
MLRNAAVIMCIRDKGTRAFGAAHTHCDGCVRIDAMGAVHTVLCIMRYVLCAFAGVHTGTHGTTHHTLGAVRMAERSHLHMGVVIYKTTCALHTGRHTMCAARGAPCTSRCAVRGVLHAVRKVRCTRHLTLCSYVVLVMRACTGWSY